MGELAESNVPMKWRFSFNEAVVERVYGRIQGTELFLQSKTMEIMLFLTSRILQETAYLISKLEKNRANCILFHKKFRKQFWICLEKVCRTLDFEQL